MAVMPSTGGEAREVFRRPGNCGGSVLYASLAWTPDQRYLMLVERTPGDHGSIYSLWRIPVAGGQPEPMGVSMTEDIKSPQMHPDGRRIFFGTVNANAAEVWALENFLPKAAAGK